MTITTPRLLLRDFTDADATFVHEVHTHPGIARFIPDQVATGPERARELTTRFQRFNDEPVHHIWCVTLRDRTPVSLIMLKPIPGPGGAASGDIEIGWRQHPAHCGHGYVTEAAGAVLTHAFAAGLPRVVAVTDPGNVASQGVCRRLGMRAEGRTHRYYDRALDLFIADSPAGEPGH